MPDYYDKLLGGIAVSLVGGVVVGTLTPVAFHAGVLLGALFATIFVYEALFRNPPRPATQAQVGVAAVVWHLFLVGLLIVAL